MGNKKGIANSLHGIGIIYRNRGNFDKALEYQIRSLEINEEIGYKEGIAKNLNSIGRVYEDQGDYTRALEYYQKSLKLQEDIGDKSGATLSYHNIGTLFLKQGRLVESYSYAKKNYLLSNELGFPAKIKSAAELLKEIYIKQKKFKEALEMYELEITMRDSLNNIETQKATIKQQTQYEYDKQKALDEKEHQNEIKQKEEKALAEKQRQNIIIASVSLVLLLVGVFSVFLYNRFKVTQRQKQIIELKEKETQEQKDIIEEKHKEITDSINYAERIQRSFLATKELLDENLSLSLRGVPKTFGTTKQSNQEIASHPTGVRNDNPDYFILFKPKDVVSGDFYWASELNNGNFAFVTADSTGHGVPGAIMSLLNITSLEKAIETETSPDKILNSARKTIIERLKKDGSKDGGKDGMDCSLIAFNKDKTKLEIASANNPVWIMRTNTDTELVEVSDTQKKGASTGSATQVIEIKPDKIPVGKHDRDQEPFTLHTIDVQKGDVIYTLTDGFPDQFGGAKGKKFMSKKLRELLQNICQKPLKEQQQILELTFKDWVGGLEQIDDVTLVGVRV
ncbi:MAG: tetratricopeptide repeat protein [Bacteroidia bacterium]